MKEELLNKLLYIKNNLDPTNFNHLQDILYIQYLNESMLDCEDETINFIIQEILSIIFLYKKQKDTQSTIPLIDTFMSTRIRKDF